MEYFFIPIGNKKNFMSLFLYLFTIVINLLHHKCVTADVVAVFVNKQHGI